LEEDNSRVLKTALLKEGLDAYLLRNNLQTQEPCRGSRKSHSKNIYPGLRSGQSTKSFFVAADNLEKKVPEKKGTINKGTS
jgi:hypothetical protein